MFKYFVEVSELKSRIDELSRVNDRLNSRLDRRAEEYEDLVLCHERKIKELKRDQEFELRMLRETNSLKIEEEKMNMLKEIQRKLTTSDVRRAVAEAKLETYEKMNTKSQIDDITKMLNKAIDGLGNKSATVNIAKG